MTAPLIPKNLSTLSAVSMHLAPDVAQREQPKTSGSPKISVADTDDSNLRRIVGLIEEEGFEVVVAHDGREAYRILQSKTDFVAAIFEIVIPHVSGPDLIRFMKREKLLKNIPVIIMTRTESARLSSEGFNAGAAILLPEPFTGNQLQTLIHTLVDSSAIIISDTVS